MLYNITQKILYKAKYISFITIHVFFDIFLHMYNFYTCGIYICIIIKIKFQNNYI
jgi:hypothetical protein